MLKTWKRNGTRDSHLPVMCYLYLVLTLPLDPLPSFPHHGKHWTCGHPGIKRSTMHELSTPHSRAGLGSSQVIISRFLPFPLFYAGKTCFSLVLKLSKLPKGKKYMFSPWYREERSSIFWQFQCRGEILHTALQGRYTSLALLKHLIFHGWQFL